VLLRDRVCVRDIWISTLHKRDSDDDVDDDNNNSNNASHPAVPYVSQMFPSKYA
jgi:hypothetical protein